MHLTTNNLMIVVALALVAAAALALSATTAIINPLAAYADWPKTRTYLAENEQGSSIAQTTCSSPQICKEFLDANPNQHAKSGCQEGSDAFLDGEKCKKVKLT